MLDFESFVTRHGEFAVQALVERIERYEGIGSAIDMPLEDRWEALMGKSWPAERALTGVAA